MARHGLKFNILNFKNKIPNLPCIILTTSQEVSRIAKFSEELVKIISKEQEEPLKKYILRVLAAYKVGFKEDYSILVFCIDPGTKHIGLVVFLEDRYLNSHTFHNIESLIGEIGNYIDYLQGIHSTLKLEFKFGIGVLSTTLEIVSNIYTYFKDDKHIRIFLVDESKTSKLNVYHEKQRIPKHEVSALILALREGIEINKKNYVSVFKNIKDKKIKLKTYNSNYLNHDNDYSTFLRELLIKIVSGELTLANSSDKLHEWRLSNID
ncbi:MAG: hypothetical protein ACFFAS_14240 [Promethearchaeota archaeon]